MKITISLQEMEECTSSVIEGSVVEETDLGQSSSAPVAENSNRVRTKKATTVAATGRTVNPHARQRNNVSMNRCCKPNSDI